MVPAGKVTRWKYSYMVFFLLEYILKAIKINYLSSSNETSSVENNTLVSLVHSHLKQLFEDLRET